MPGDRLTKLPDTMLCQILSHAPAKEAVCTGALSRPWRSLWLSSGVLNLDSRSYGASRMRDSRSLIFLRDANDALRALAATAGEGSGLRKLTFTYFFAPNCDDSIYWSLRHINDGLHTLLTDAPAARGLDELHVHVSPMAMYSLCIVALPSATLHVLHLDGLELTPSQTWPAWSPSVPVLSFPRLGATVLSFPRLETLCLRRCTVRLTDIQSIVDAAPLLATLELDRVHLSCKVDTSSSDPRLLRCTRVTDLSLADLRFWWCGWYQMEFDAPSLRHFAYRVFHHAEVLSVNLERPGARRRAEQIKELNLRMMKDGLLLRL